ncbi:MAG: class I SAM-dependent methyltransferase [Planctomycetota bacterium]
MTEDETSGGEGEVRAKWQRSRAGDDYVRSRFSSRNARQRDARLLARVAARAGVRLAEASPVLDVPCGTGRMAAAAAALGPAARYVGADVSASMLEAFEAPEAARVRASVFALPSANGAFDAVVCCRFLHHLGAPEQQGERRAALAELARASRRWVLASWWDAASLRGRSAARKARRGTRTACRWSELAEDLRAVGLEPRARAYSLRFVSAQAWFAAELRSQIRSQDHQQR